MFETTGAPAILASVRSLAALVALPLFAAVIAAYARGRTAARVGVAASGGTLALAIVFLARAIDLGPGHLLGWHVADVFRVGQLDLALDLTLDTTTAAFVVVVALLSLAAVLRALWIDAGDPGPRVAWVELLTGGTILVALADQLPIAAGGLAVSTVAAWGLSRGTTARALVASLAGDASVLVAACALFWSLGGSFGPSGYTPDAQPRFAIVTATNAEAPEGKSVLVLDTYAGALLVADDGPPLPGEPIRSPLSVTLDPGIYSFRILAGVASQDALVSHVTLAPGRSYVLMPFGPTTSLRNLTDQLEVPRPSAVGPLPVRAMLSTRSLLGFRATTLFAVLLVVGVLLRLVMAARTSGGLAPALEVLAGVVLVLRVAPIFEAPSSTALAVFASLCAALMASRGAAEPVPRDAMRAVAAASGAIAIACTLAGDPAAAFVVVSAGTIGCAAALSAVDVAGDVRWLGVACAASAGVLPAAGISPGAAEGLGAVLAQAAAGSLVAMILAVALLVALALVSVASLRVYDAYISGRQKSVRGKSAAVGPRALAALLAAIALASGAVLGVGTSPFGGRAAPLVRHVILGGEPLEGSPKLAAFALVLAVGAAALGVVLARLTTNRPTPPVWLGVPSRATVSLAAGLGRLATWLARSVAALDREIVEDITDVVAGALARAGDLLRRGEARASKASGAVVDRASAAAIVRTGLDDPRTAERVRTGILLAMVAILGIVVLSSLLLG
ncbi:MAG TPA: hypothetical protein VIF62_40110 [Labilithrix sp.]